MRRAARKNNLNPKYFAFQLYINNLKADSLAMGRAKIEEFISSYRVKGVSGYESGSTFAIYMGVLHL